MRTLALGALLLVLGLGAPSGAAPAKRGWLPEARIAALLDALLSENAPALRSRSALLSGLPRDAVSKLPKRTSDAACLESDLRHLNVLPRGEEAVPLERWLQNGVLLFGAQRFSNALRDAAAAVAASKMDAPVRDPRTLTVGAPLALTGAPLLSAKELGEVLGAAERLGLSLLKGRDALLSALEPRLRGRLENRASPLEQVRADVRALNRLPRKPGTAPLADWLSTAALLSKPRVEAQVFERALARAGGAPRTPAASEQRSGPSAAPSKRPASVKSLLPEAVLREVHAAVISAHLFNSRDALLSGIDASIAGRIRANTRPSAQLNEDLRALNRAGPDESRELPLRLWLLNAKLLAGPRVEAAVFERALAKLPAATARRTR